LIQSWDAYAETIEGKVHLKNTMINCKPVLLSDNFYFNVGVHNPAQKEELISNSLNILKGLRTHLQNGLIQMSVYINENLEKKVAYTSTEKFEFLNNINPVLSKLVDELDLVVD
jgi:DNA polymerase-3 subunit gamma/tau